MEGRGGGWEQTVRLGELSCTRGLLLTQRRQRCTQSERDETSASLAATRQQLASLREQYDRHLLEVQADAKTQRATVHEEALKEREALKEQMERWVGRMA